MQMLEIIIIKDLSLDRQEKNKITILQKDWGSKSIIQLTSKIQFN